MSPRADLGERIVCHNCSAKYYTLNRADPACPSCNTKPLKEEIDPIQAAMDGISDMPRPKQEPEPAPADTQDLTDASVEDEEEGFSGDLGDLGDIEMEEED